MSDVGRPSLYTPELAATICDRISNGESLRQVCRDESMPCTSTVLKWAREIEEFSQRYAKARDALLEHWAEEITEIADDGSNDWIKREKDEGRVEVVLDAEHVNRSRLRIDTRKWLLSKLAPKRYGERVTAALTGEDGGPIQVADVSETEIARRIAFALSKGVQQTERKLDS